MGRGGVVGFDSTATLKCVVFGLSFYSSGLSPVRHINDPDALDFI